MHGWVRSELSALGWQVPAGRSPIIPIEIGAEDVSALAERLAERGHFAPAIRPPTESRRGCRLRLTVTLGHREADCRRLIQAMSAGEL